MSSIQSIPATLPHIEVPAPAPSAPSAPSAPAAVPRAPRLVSLDVFRGATIAAMVLVNQSPSPKYWPLDHATWHGWTPTDLIFPFFLFIVGVATPFSMARRASTGTESRGTLLAHIWSRALALFVLGQLLTGIPFNNFSTPPAGYAWITTLRAALIAFSIVGMLLLLIPWRSRRLQIILPIALFVLVYAVAVAMHLTIRNAGPGGDFKFGNGLLDPTNLRIPGVLQRIGICYGVAATLGLFFGWRMVLVWSIALMAIYSVLMLKTPYPSHVTGSLTMEDNLARKIDQWLLIREGRWNHAYRVYPDNEGALSTLPAISTTLIGILVGVWLRTYRPAAERAAGLLVFGLFTLLAGMALNKWLMPINKILWTPSFTVFTAGMAMLCLGTVFFFVDVLNRRAWAWPFKVYGMNAIAAFALSGLIYKLAVYIKLRADDETISLWKWSQDRVAEAMGSTSGITTPDQSLVFALAYVCVIGLLMWILYVFKIFVKV